MGSLLSSDSRKKLMTVTQRGYVYMSESESESCCNEEHYSKRKSWISSDCCLHFQKNSHTTDCASVDHQFRKRQKPGGVNKPRVQPPPTIPDEEGHR